jgi:hypothetical protein
LKKFVPYIFGSLFLLLLVLVVVYAPVKKSRTLDERITLRLRDKIPYGMHVANRLLRATFSNVHTFYDRAAPGNWEGIDMDTSGQVVFLMSSHFDPALYELNRLSRFIEQGNYVFIITQRLGPEAESFFRLAGVQPFLQGTSGDSLQVSLSKSFPKEALYVYPGKRYDSYFAELDTITTTTLGSNADGYPNFVQLQSGPGRLFIHLAPLAFSNYFLLHKNNIDYFKTVVSLIPANVHAIVWNEYYLTRRSTKEKEPSILRVLWQQEPFRWALITAVATLLLYVLSAMRRQQRVIPYQQKPVNASLDFVRTIGRLYYERRDHHNLGKKLAAYFMEHARNRYKIIHTEPDAAFLSELHYKSNYAHEELKKIVDFMQYLNQYTYITEAELARFYRLLNLFYKNTDGTIV